MVVRNITSSAESSYDIALAGVTGPKSEQAVRRVISDRGGELTWMRRERVDRSRLHLRVKASRVEDVDDMVASLEAEGFEVTALVAHAARRAPR